jgi:capsular polysaccharide biosynthesis protein
VILTQKYTSKRKLPVNYVESDFSIFQHELSKVIPSSKLIEIRNVNINNKSIIFKNGKEIVTRELNKYSFSNKKKLISRIKFFLDHYIKKKRIVLNTDGILFTDKKAKNYFHWLTEALPRLYLIEKYLRNRTVLIPFELQNCDYINHSLSLFKDIRIRYIKENEVIHCEKLFVPTQVSHGGGNYNDEVIQKIRKFVRTTFKNHSSHQKFKKIYISRKEAAYRKILNEKDVINLLDEYGFETLYFEKIPWKEQIGIAMNCKYLFSLHGAGLTNMLFMPMNSSVFEFRRKGDNHNNCYFSLASALDLKYYYQNCDVDDINETTQKANFIVNIKELRYNLENFFKK